MTRATRLLSLAAIAALAVAACGGSSATPTPSPTATPTATPEPTATPAPSPTPEPTASPAAEGPDLEGAASALDAIEKYQLDMTINGAVPGLPAQGEIRMSGLVDQTTDSFAFEMSGVEGLGTADTPVRFVVIGEDAWVNVGGTGYLSAPGGASQFGDLKTNLAPKTLLGSFQMPTTGMQFFKVADEEKNGAQTEHYRVDAAVVPQVASYIGEDGVMDIWVAVDGGYLVSMILDGTIEGNDMQLSIDLSRINDASIAIEPPN